MFTESLLESSNVARKHNHKRWPMTLAFVLEMIAVSFLLLLPLASTGVIPVLAHIPDRIFVPMAPVKVLDQSDGSNSSGQRGPTARSTEVVRVFNNKTPVLPFGPAHPTIDQPPNPFDRNIQKTGPQVGDLMCKDNCTSVGRPAEPQKRVRFSHLSEALLVRKVDPVYPRMAVVAHTYGAVQLHAIIAKDGSIQSLSVVNGHPILAQAALDAVRQWRYKPYVLNDEPVEVETFITVHFRPAMN